MPVPRPPMPPYARYSIDVVCAYEASTQLRPVSTVPIETSPRGPKRSVSDPWNGEENACSSTSSENVTCSSGSATPSFAMSGFVIRVHTYCGLEIVIMQTRPRPSWIQRVCAAVRAVGEATAFKDRVGVSIMFLRFGLTYRQMDERAPSLPPARTLTVSSIQQGARGATARCLTHSLPASRGPIAARVVACLQTSVAVPDDRPRVAHCFVIRPHHLDVMAETTQRIDRVVGKPRLQLECFAGLPPGPAQQPARRIDSGLRIPAEVRDARKHGALRLRLAVAAHVSIHHRASIGEARESRVQRVKRSSPRHQRIARRGIE